MEHNIADLKVRQEPSKNQFVVKGDAKGQQIAMTFYMSYEDSFKGKIPSFVTFSSGSSSQKILLNKEDSVTFDAVEDKDFINRIKITEQGKDCKYLFHFVVLSLFSSSVLNNVHNLILFSAYASLSNHQ